MQVVFSEKYEITGCVPTALKFLRRNVDNNFFWKEIDGTRRVKRSVGAVYYLLLKKV